MSRGKLPVTRALWGGFRSIIVLARTNKSLAGDQRPNSEPLVNCGGRGEVARGAPMHLRRRPCQIHGASGENHASCPKQMEHEREQQAVRFKKLRESVARGWGGVRRGGRGEVGCLVRDGAGSHPTHTRAAVAGPCMVQVRVEPLQPSTSSRGGPGFQIARTRPKTRKHTTRTCTQQHTTPSPSLLVVRPLHASTRAFAVSHTAIPFYATLH